MKRLVAVFLLAIMMILPLKGAGAQEYGKVIAQYVGAHQDTTAGVSVAVFTGEETLYEGYFGHGDMENGVPMSPDTVVEWGSVTKLLVWVSVMQQKEAGKIDLDADVRDYLPENFLRALKYDEKITMKHLMSHNAGFEETLIGMMTARENEILSLEGYLRTFQPRQIYRPGEVTAYSNWGVTLAGYIVERVSGQDFAAYVHEHIFDKLGMTRTAILPDLSDNAYVQQKRGELQCYTADRTLIPGAFQYIVMYPAGMCTSTLSDFAAFGSALIRRDEALMGKETWEEMFTPTSYFGDKDNTPLNCHGFWHKERGVSMYGHGGNTTGCSSMLLIDPENGVGMTVMTNQSGETVYNEGLYDEIFGKYPGQPTDFRGWTNSARTIKTGPLKIYKLFTLIPFTDGIVEEYFTGVHAEIVEENGQTRIVMPYGDQMVISFASLLPEFALLLLWGLSHILWIICLIALLFRRKLPRKVKMWRLSVSVSALLPSVGVAVIACSLFGMTMLPVWCYRAISAAGLVIGMVMAGQLLYGIGLYRQANTKKQRVFHTLLMGSLGIALVNIVYWQMGAFWLI
ncbi:MAG: beta-lactamase family protein [Clostridia bacterium]|nr:beta-lactamase family protein [Clostridia bacterium]